MDWPGLLKWSMKYSDGTSSRPKISDEDCEFLQKAVTHALEQMIDHHKMVEDCVKKLSSEDFREVLTALKIIETALEEEPEVARNLEKVNAVQPLVTLLRHPSHDVLESLLTIITFAFANNPKIQSSAAEYGCLSALMALCEPRQSETEHDVMIRARAIGALSASIRNNPTSELRVVKSGAIALLVDILSRSYEESSSAHDRARTRAVSLLRHLISQGRVPYGSMQQANLCNMLIATLQTTPKMGESVETGELAASIALLLLTKFAKELANDDCYPRTRLMEAIQVRLSQLEALGKMDREEADARELECSTLRQCLDCNFV